VKPVLDFGVLGPLRAVVDGVTVHIGPRKHRILLASLLLRANRPVHLDELVDRLWPTAEIPRCARSTVQTYVMRLRHELGPAGCRIRTGPEAYSIELGADQLDLDRFVRHTEQAGRARRSGALSEARAHLGSALAQWRGAPLADVPSATLARFEVPHLIERRCRATEQRIELDLVLGSPDDLVSELHTLIAEHPLHERFRALLMRAYCRAGRHAEALAAYHAAARLLADELGVEPGQELRLRYARLLAGQG
jgi:DNA-binding SARP family transcriptional activator